VREGRVEEVRGERGCWTGEGEVGEGQEVRGICTIPISQPSYLILFFSLYLKSNPNPNLHLLYPPQWLLGARLQNV
jgi:hypothetical protein